MVKSLIQKLSKIILDEITKCFLLKWFCLIKNINLSKENYDFFFKHNSIEIFYNKISDSNKYAYLLESIKEFDLKIAVDKGIIS